MGVNICPGRFPSNPLGKPSPFDVVRDLDASWVRIGFRADEDSGLVSNETFAFYDGVASGMISAGAKVLFLLDYSTQPNVPWGSSDEDTWTEYTASFAERVGMIASHYASLGIGANVAYEIWNEEDLEATYVPPSSYAGLLRAAHDAIKGADPAASPPVVIGGLASGDPGYVAEVVAAGGGVLLADGLGLHPYGQRPSPDWPDPEWGFGNIADLMLSYFQVASLPQWVTEVGTDDENVQNDFPWHVFKAIEENQATVPCPVALWFCWSDGMVPPFGLLDDKMNRKPSFSSFQNFTLGGQHRSLLGQRDHPVLAPGLASPRAYHHGADAAAVVPKHANYPPFNPGGRLRPGRSMTIGVVGGSISFGSGVSKGARYSDLLAKHLNITVMNEALPATQVHFISFCLDSVMPHVDLDFLVVEYAANDCGASSEKMLTESSDGNYSTTLLPMASMERLLRRVQITMPLTRIIMLYVCGPKSCSNCNGLYSTLADRYRILEVSPTAVGISIHFPDGIHPDEAGHIAIARLVGHAVTSLDNRLKPFAQQSMLPPPVYRSTWERSDEVWSCRTCTHENCDSLTPVSSKGFSVDRQHLSTNPVFHKWGYSAVLPSSEIRFSLSTSGGHVLLSFLCSYHDVGKAVVGLELGGRVYRTTTVDLLWQQRSSQQCVSNIGAYYPGSVLIISSEAQPSQKKSEVKLFGVYIQAVAT